MKLGDEFIRFDRAFWPVSSGRGTHYWNGHRIVRKPRPLKIWKWAFWFVLALTIMADNLYCMGVIG